MSDASQVDLAWYAVHAKRNAERLTHDALLRKGFSAFLPMETVNVRHARRTHVVARSLFRRYLFVGLDPQHPPFYEVRKTLGVDWIVSNSTSPVRIPLKVIQMLQDAETARAFDKTLPDAGLQPGDEVRILTGPAAGFVAKILATPSDQRIELVLTHLGRKLPVVTPLANLRKTA